MKKIGILLLLTTFSLNLFCQQNSVIINDSTYHYLWDSETNDWRLFWRDVYTYDDNGNQTEIIQYKWNTFANDWEGIHRWVRAYDADGNVTVTVKYIWDFETDDWIYYKIGLFYWSDLNTSISNGIIDLNYKVYPIPTNDILTIEIARFDHYSINITSLNGQFIYGTEMEEITHQIDLSSFEKGVYFITIRSEDFVATKKIIKL